MIPAARALLEGHVLPLRRSGVQALRPEQAVDVFRRIESKFDFAPDAEIGIEIDPEALVGRLGARRVCSACQAVFNLEAQPPARPGVCDACGGPLEQRPDDAPAVIRERLRVYLAQTEPLKALYRAKGVYRAVNGEAPIPAVNDFTSHALHHQVAEAALTGYLIEYPSLQRRNIYDQGRQAIQHLPPQ